MSTTVNCLMETLGHLIEAVNGTSDKFIVDEFFNIFFRIYIVLLDFIGLLEKAGFQFDQVAIVPMKYGNFQFWVGNFADDSHDVNITELTTPVIMLFFVGKFSAHPISA